MEEQGELEMAAADYEVLARTLELRITLLSELNTQTMLVAGTAFAMLSSLELEAIGGEGEEGELAHLHDDGAWLPKPRGVTLACVYLISVSIALGSSVWVLYISNWLINESTRARVRAREGLLRGGIVTFEAVARYVETWVASVRFHYITSIIAVVVAAYVMALRLLPWTWITLLGASIALCYIAAAFISSARGDFPRDEIFWPSSPRSRPSSKVLT